MQSFKSFERKDILFNNAIFATEKMADYLWQKQQVTLNNIANSSTPGYKAQYVTFEDELKRRIGSDKFNRTLKIKDGIGEAKIRVHTKKDESHRMDGNNVNMDVEQVELASTNIEYQLALTSINNEFMRIKSAIR